MKKLFRSIYEGCLAWGEFMNRARHSRLKGYNDRYWYY